MKARNFTNKIFTSKAAFLLAKENDLPLDSYIAYATGNKKYVTIQDVKWLIIMLQSP